VKPYRHFILALKILFVFVLCFLALRNVVVPEPYGKFDSFWRHDLEYWTRRFPLHHRGSPSCREAGCHPAEGLLWAGSRHRNVSCETCHGAEAAPGRAAVQCLTCHRPLKARPANFPQVSPLVHYPDQACLGCHDPHAPIPLMTHPMPAGRKERDACLMCHLRDSGALPDLRAEQDTTVLGRMFRPPRVRADHGGRKFCISCHAQSPTLSELATMVHGQDVSYCPKCHREGGLAGSGFR